MLVACAQSDLANSRLIYSSPGAYKTHRMELKSHPLIMLDKAKRKHSLTNGWKMQYTSLEYLNWVYRHPALTWLGGEHVVDFWTFQDHFLSFALYCLKLVIYPRSHSCLRVEQRRCTLVSCLVDGPFQTQVQASKAWAKYFIHSSSKSSARQLHDTLPPCRHVFWLLQQPTQAHSIHVPCGISTGVLCHEHGCDITFCFTQSSASTC